MYEFIIGSLLQAEMTSRQSTLFRFVTRALFAIPDATIHTFHDILKNGTAKYQTLIDTLDDTAREFFATDFNNNAQFKQTREQVAARLWAVLGNQTFLRMFSSPRSKVDFFTEINTPGKVILINAEKGLLKDEGTELFGRFFLALINQAAAQRSSMPADKRLPCYVYVDECHNYIKNDPKIQIILAEARQQKVGVILANQYLGQIDPPVRNALAANTSIKMAARLDTGAT
jgi:type IV secretory pathway VirB4 component